MPNKYSRAVGSRRYADYTSEKLNDCLEAIRSGRLRQREAAKNYNIHRRTLNYKHKNCHTIRPGKPLIFVNEEEKAFVSCIIAMSNFGFPLNQQDITYIVRDHLRKVGKVVAIFRDNVPGKDWVRSFVARHPEISVRFVSNIEVVQRSV